MKHVMQLIALMVLGGIIGTILTYTLVQERTPERGCAEMTISLDQSIIVVTDVDGDTLLTREAHLGDWDRIWESIENKY